MALLGLGAGCSCPDSSESRLISRGAQVLPFDECGHGCLSWAAFLREDAGAPNADCPVANRTYWIFKILQPGSISFASMRSMRSMRLLWLCMSCRRPFDEAEAPPLESEEPRVALPDDDARSLGSWPAGSLGLEPKELSSKRKSFLATRPQEERSAYLVELLLVAAVQEQEQRATRRRVKSDTRSSSTEFMSLPLPALCSAAGLTLQTVLCFVCRLATSSQGPSSFMQPGCYCFYGLHVQASVVRLLAFQHSLRNINCVLGPRKRRGSFFEEQKKEKSEPEDELAVYAEIFKKTSGAFPPLRCAVMQLPSCIWRSCRVQCGLPKAKAECICCAGHDVLWGSAGLAA